MGVVPLRACRDDGQEAKEGGREGGREHGLRGG